MFFIFYSGLYRTEDSDGSYLVMRGDCSISYKGLEGLAVSILFGIIFYFSINVKGL